MNEKIRINLRAYDHRLLDLSVKEIVETAGTGFAFPSQSLYVEKMLGDHADVFIPPSKK